MQRGVIASPAIISVLSDGFKLHRSISAEEVRYYAMYWDKVVVAGSDIVYVEIPEEDVLIETGVIERPHVRLYGTLEGAAVGHSFALGIMSKTQFESQA